MAPTPEQRTRERIDALLTAAGWLIQDNTDFNRNAGLGVAVREFVLPGGPCDYLLFVDGKAAGVVEAKKSGATLSGVAEQAARYMFMLVRCFVHEHKATSAGQYNLSQSSLAELCLPIPPPRPGDAC